MFVCGNNNFKQLGKISNDISNKSSLIYPPSVSSINIKNLLSISTYSEHTIVVDKNLRAYGIGENKEFQISPALPRKAIDNETEILFPIEKTKKVYKFFSAVCTESYTLYQVTQERGNTDTKLIFISKNQRLFLNLSGRSPYFLYGGHKTSAAIDSEGSVFIINEEIVKASKGQINKSVIDSDFFAVQVACCDDFAVVLDSNGCTYEAQISSIISAPIFKEVDELLKKKITSISGTHNHCFAVCQTGQVFGRGENSFCCLGIEKRTKEVEKFEPIESLQKYKIVSASAGYDQSLFTTNENEILVCGSNLHGHVLLDSPDLNSVYPPVKTEQFCKEPFLIAGQCFSAVMEKNEVPKYTPNQKIKFKYDEVTQLKIIIEKKKNEILNMKQKEKEYMNTLKAKTEEIEKQKNEIIQLKQKLSTKNDETAELNIKLQEKVIETTQLKRKVKTSDEKTAVFQKELQKAIITDKPSNIENRKSYKKEERIQPLFEILDENDLKSIEKVKLIGEGSMSKVYEVEYKQHLAQKIFENDEDNMVDLKKFVREYETMISLRSPNVVRAYGIYFGDDKHPPSILLELCKCNLKQKLKSLDKKKRRQVLIDVCNGMKDIHNAKLMHRNLKLENIFFDDNDNAKVGEFGFCTNLDSDNDITQTPMIGKSEFLAPELLRGDSNYNEKVDVYAFGSVVYYVMSDGKLPKFNFLKAAKGQMPPIPDSFSKFTKELIEQCWDFEPKNRPSFSDIYKKLNNNLSKLDGE